jgi:hypothetical protein
MPVSQSVMGHLTYEQDNFSCTCLIITKLGMYVGYDDPKKPIDFGFKVQGHFVKTLRQQ